jgi:hypothetical protein
VSLEVRQHIANCKRRIEIVRAFVEKASAEGHPSADAERQLILEMALLGMLEAQLAADPQNSVANANR